jgi:ubiquinone/menaquinone biosynthesis C-methylase UbiE
MLELRHELKLAKTRDEKARMNFVSTLRSHVLNDMANGMRAVYDAEVAPALRAVPKDGPDVHRAIRGNEFFRFYSSLRVTAQDMVWQSVIPALERERPSLKARAQSLGDRAPLGSLTLDPDLPVPRSVSAIDVHLMPGNYDGEYEEGDLSAGALYDNGLAVFSFGLMGQNLDDIGQSIVRYVKWRHPEFAPRSVLDLGCTIGHNTGAWKEVYPQAEVHGIDVSAPCLRYGLARARAQGRAIHFHQMNAESLAFPDASFDVVFSSMFLHEVPRKGIERVFREAHRVLRPGGLMLHMELPPNGQLSPYDAFYLDWDSYYNNEPFYKPYRDLDPRSLCVRAGFAPGRFVEYVVPSIGWYGEEAVKAAVGQAIGVDSDKTGRLADGIRWYCFGAWK